MTDLNFLRSPERGVKSTSASYLKQSSLFRLYKYYLLDSIYVVRNYGFKTLLALRGFKIFLFINIIFFLELGDLYYKICNPVFFLAKFSPSLVMQKKLLPLIHTDDETHLLLPLALLGSGIFNT